jgi:DNA-binding NarL/FixJ family response regulator
VFEGGIYVPAALADISSAPIKLPHEAQVEAAATEPVTAVSPTVASPLTPRQQDVLDLLVRGKTNKEIALALGLGEGTVKIHMAAIFRFFGVNNRAAAAVAGARPYPKRERSLMSGI